VHFFWTTEACRDLRGDSGKIGRVTVNAMTLAKRSTIRRSGFCLRTIAGEVLLGLCIVI